jgi:outer membrane protein
MEKTMQWFTKQIIGSALIALPLSLTALPSQAENLTQVWQLAQAEDVQLAIAAADIDLQAEKRQQAKAATLPSIGATANLNYVDNSAIGVANTGQSYTLDMKQGIYHRDVILQSQQVELLVDNSRLGYQLAEQQLIMRVAAAYFAQLEAQDAVQLALQEHDSVAERHKEIQARYDVGVSNLVTLQEAQARLDMMQAQIVATRGQLAESHYALGEILNRELSSLSPLPASASSIELNFLPLQTLDVWVADAEQNSLQLQQIRKQLQVARVNIQAEEAALTPGIDLIAQYSHTDNTHVLYGADADQYMVGIKISMPIYTGGYTQSKVAEATLLQRQLQRQLQQAQRSIGKAVRSAYVSVDSAQQLVQAREQVQASAELAFKAMESAVDVGSRTHVDLLDVQSQVFSARRDLAQAKYQLLLSQLQLRLIAGSLSPADLQTIDALLL